MENKKKYDNVKIEQNELTPIAIGTYGAKKNSSLSGLVILILFVIAIIFLPSITSYINEYINSKNAPTNPNLGVPSEPDSPIQEDEENENENDIFYLYNPNLVIDRTDVSLSDFLVNDVDNTITYNITNKTNTKKNLEELQYFLEIFDINKILLERVKIASPNELSPNAYEIATKNIYPETAAKIGYILLVKKSVNEYPNIEINEDSEGISTLSCKRSDEVINYTFKNNYLSSVASNYGLINNTTNYEDLLYDAKIKAGTYNNMEGIVSIFNETESSFNVKTSIDLTLAERMYIFNADTFSLNTEPKVVKFEMETQNFICE